MCQATDGHAGTRFRTTRRRRRPGGHWQGRHVILPHHGITETPCDTQAELTREPLTPPKRQGSPTP